MRNVFGDRARRGHQQSSSVRTRSLAVVDWRQTAQRSSGRNSGTCWSVQCAMSCWGLPSCSALTGTVCVAVARRVSAVAPVRSVGANWRARATLWQRSCATRCGTRAGTGAALRASCCETWGHTKPDARTVNIVAHWTPPGSPTVP